MKDESKGVFKGWKKLKTVISRFKIISLTIKVLFHKYSNIVYWSLPLTRYFIQIIKYNKTFTLI